VLARETHEIPRLRDDCRMPGGRGDRDAAAAAEPEQALVAQLPERVTGAAGAFLASPSSLSYP
jgi:hypothetical protein